MPLCCELIAVALCTVGTPPRRVRPGQPVHVWVQVPRGTTHDDTDIIEARIGPALAYEGPGSLEMTVEKHIEKVMRDPQPGQEGFDARGKEDRIREVVKTLEHETDWHWVPKGRSKRIQIPSPHVVTDRMGEPTSAEEIAVACPDVKRIIPPVDE